MPSIRVLYNEEVIQAHREAIQVLRELLAEATDPLERRRLATALLKARPVKELAADETITPDTGAASEPSAPITCSSPLSETYTCTSPHPAFSPDNLRPLAPHAPAQPEGTIEPTPCLLLQYSGQLAPTPSLPSASHLHT